MSSLSAPADLLFATAGAGCSDGAVDEMVVTFLLLMLGYVVGCVVQEGRRQATRSRTASSPAAVSTKEADELSPGALHDVSADGEDTGSDRHPADQVDSSDIDELASTDIDALIEDSCARKWLEASLSALDEHGGC